MRKQQMLKIAKLASSKHTAFGQQAELRRALKTKAENKAYNEPEDVFENFFCETAEQIAHTEKLNKAQERRKRLAIRRAGREEELNSRALKIYAKTGKRACWA